MEFMTHDGTMITTIRELLDYLQKCSDKDFAIHRNDFVKWIEESDSMLALELDGETDKKDYMRKIKIRLDE